MPVETGNQELRLRLVETSLPFLPLHERTGLRYIPGALGFIKQNYMLWRCPVITEVFIAEVMNVLDESLNLLFRFTLSDAGAFTGGTLNPIAR